MGIKPSKKVEDCEFTIHKRELYQSARMMMGILVCLTKKDVPPRMQFYTDCDDETLDVEDPDKPT